MDTLVWVSEFLLGDLGKTLLPGVRAVSLGHNTEVVSPKLAQLPKTCHPPQLPGHRGRDNARGRAETHQHRAAVSA